MSKTGPQQTRAKRRRRKRQAVWEMVVKPTKHCWMPYSYSDCFMAGQSISERPYFDCGGAKCLVCQKVVVFWDERYREDTGKTEKRDTGNRASKYGCSGFSSFGLVG